MDIKYLKLLSEKFPTIQSASNEIINLKAITSLPKGTEHFMSDLHGEEEAFNHIMNNCSGVIKEKIDMLFGHTISKADRENLATLIYYPKEKIKHTQEQNINLEDFYRVRMHQLIKIYRLITSKYSRSHVRKALPIDYQWILDELIYIDNNGMDRTNYIEGIIESIIQTDGADQFIQAVATAIKNLAVDSLHIVGDIFDRGSHPDTIIDLLMARKKVDVEWGNHDIVWMGACSGSLACIANVLNLSLTYNNTEVLELSYGISLRPLAMFAKKTYQNVNCFLPKGQSTDESEIELAQMRKAIAIIMFKIEGQTIMRNKNFNLESRLLLDKINYDTGEIQISGNTYKLLDNHFPTIDNENPYLLTEEEEYVMNKLKTSFMHSEKLHNHINFLYEHGSIYLVRNDNLLYHGCIPLDENGDFVQFDTLEGMVYGKSYMDYCDKIARQAFFTKHQSLKKQKAQDFMWYLWCGASSPLFGRDKMRTFERLLIADKKTHIENKNSYYKLYDKKETFDKIAKEFNLQGDHAHIINGHMPVKEIEGENPLKAGGKIIIIDGGFCKAYHKTTGIAGYTLIYNSYGMRLSAHTEFMSKEDAVENNADIHSTVNIFEHLQERIKVSDTDIGKELENSINDLTELVQAYRNGDVKQRSI